MRNIVEYRKNYYQLPFERRMEVIRRGEILQVLSVYSYKSILEIGCGYSTIANYLDINSKKVTIIEPDKHFALKAKREQPSVNVINNFFEKTEPIQNIDLIIISCLLHEIQNIELFIEHLKKFCQEETLVHVNVPNGHSFHRLLAVEMGLLENAVQPTNTQFLMQQKREAYTMNTLIKTFIDQGFYVLEKGGYFIKTNTHEQLEQMFDKGIIDQSFLDALSTLGREFPENAAEIFANFKLTIRG
jgi:2-polyprenyl-3-methyl-5-hydroxy-6-metoxy-1,4-benzoquinol methylase